MTKKKSKAEKIKESTQIDGQIPAAKELPTRLDVLFGTAQNKYKVNTKEQYQSYLQGLTVSDLREEAIKVGLIPTRNLERLRKQLITEFDKYTMAYNHVSSKKEDNLTKEQEQTLLNILRAVK